MANELDLMAAVEQELRDAKVPFKKQVVIGDTKPDFVFKTPEGNHVVLEVKNWETNTANTARALHQVKLYKRLSKATAAMIVTGAGEPITLGGGGLVPVTHLAEWLVTMFEAEKGKKAAAPASAPRVAPKKKVFASMPFSSQYDDTFLVAIAPAALTNNAVAERVDHDGSAGNVVAQIQSMIRAAKVVVADVSDSRPNVLHEIGFAEALGKPVIQICSTGTNALPFNVRNNQTIPYSIGQTAKLRKRLESELQKVI